MVFGCDVITGRTWNLEVFDAATVMIVYGYIDEAVLYVSQHVAA